MSIKDFFKGLLLGGGGSQDSTARDITEKGSSSVLSNYINNPKEFISWTYICIDRNAKKLTEASPIIFTHKPDDIEKYIEKSCKFKKNYKSDYLEVNDKSHPLLNLLYYPNNFQSGRIFFYQLYVNLMLHGAAFIKKIYQNNDVIALQHLNPGEMNIKQSGDLSNVNADFIYAGKKIDSSEIIPILITPLFTFSPYGPVLAAANDLLISNVKNKIDKNMIQNYSRPDVILSVDGASQEDLKRMVIAIESKLKGPSNVGSVVGLNSDTNIDFIERPELIVGDSVEFAKKICSYFGFPYAKIDSISANRSSMETVENAWVKDIKFFLDITFDAFNSNLLIDYPEMEKDSYIWYDDIISENYDYNLKLAIEAYKNGIIDRFNAKLILNIDANDEDKDIYASIGEEELEEPEEEPEPEEELEET